MKPYGWRMRANDFNAKDESVSVVVKKRGRDLSLERQEFRAALERNRLTFASWPKWMRAGTVSERRELDSVTVSGDD